ncbi:MAG TPA: NAD(P)-binding domain-containing protein [Acidobacteriaceae bacterium]|nr:NAD(P)-binding domain-containing protein [Acidobacteriaceae bacterium]
MVIGVIGVGSIASAMVAGLCRGDERREFLLSPRNPQMAAALASSYPSVRVAENNEAVARESSVVLLCLRPSDAALLRGLPFRRDASVISVMAGISVKQLGEIVGSVESIARTIPLPSVAVGRGVTPVYPFIEPARSLFAELGTVVDVADESSFNLFSASTATVAAYFGYLGRISDWLAGRGIASLAARQYVAAMFGEIAGSLHGTEPDFERLAKEHTTPGGINERFAQIMAERGVWEAVDGGLDQIRRRLESR